MAFDAALAQRIRNVLESESGVTEKHMFGGVVFILNGNMAVGVAGNDLMVRVGPERHEALLAAPHARAMDFTGKPMKGFIFVAPEGISRRAELVRWVRCGVDYAGTLPCK
jgi:TfoX/Sxy family transcriptional regulator of competence genes